MKKLLNNPLFVGAMALVAVGVVVMNVVRPTRGPGAPHQTTSVKKAVPEESSDKKPAQPATEMSPEEVADRDRIRWRQKPAIRDPFRPKTSVSGKTSKRTRAQKQFRLYGIWVEPGVRLAAINDKIVSEGDRIGGYRVDKIKPDSVLLKGPRNSRLLKFRNK